MATLRTLTAVSHRLCTYQSLITLTCSGVMAGFNQKVIRRWAETHQTYVLHSWSVYPEQTGRSEWRSLPPTVQIYVSFSKPRKQSVPQVEAQKSLRQRQRQSQSTWYMNLFWFCCILLSVLLLFCICFSHPPPLSQPPPSSSSSPSPPPRLPQKSSQ